MEDNDFQKKVEFILKNYVLQNVVSNFDSDKMNRMGITNFNEAYIEIKKGQDKHVEAKKLAFFLQKFIEYYSKKVGKSSDDFELTFINYGKTELVYVLTDNGNNKVTLLVKQPSVRFGDVYEEMNNLLSLKQRNDNVIAPIDYFRLNDQELYVTPYINQARCVASSHKWGMYVPEPWYRFQEFTPPQEEIVMTCMIAILVSLYDFENQRGIINCKFGGGDFMLSKKWENEQLTIENTLNNMFLISARKTMCCPYDEYLQLIRNEFSKSTIDEGQHKLVINLRARAPIKREYIDKGIKLGEELNSRAKVKTLFNKQNFI